MKPILLLLILAALTSPAAAATYHVATSGSDAGPGSAAAPWATIQRAVDAVAPGDVILVQPGTYAGCRIERSGAPGMPCTLAAATPGTVLINAASPRNRHQSHVEVESFGVTISHWIIDGFEVAGGARYGIDIRGTDDVTVRRCNVHGSRVTGIFDGFAERATYEDNESWNNGEHGIYHSNSGDDFIIRGNRLHHNAAAGVHMNGDLSQGGDGLLSRGLVERNVIWENGMAGGSGINCDGVTDSIIRNNLLHDNHASGIALYGIDGAASSRDNLVAHNTVVLPDDGRSRWAVNMVDFGLRPPPVGNRILGNILYTARPVRGSIAIWSPAAAGFVSDENIVVDRFSADNDSTIIPLAAWQAAGHDLSSVVSTPDQLFVDAANGDYRLKPGSPAIDRVTPLAQVMGDIDGTSRPQGARSDAGAYEWTGCGAPLPAGLVRDLRLSADRRTMTWSQQPGMDWFDVVSGDVLTLRTLGLQASVTRCLADDLAAPPADDPDPLPSGGARFLLVRAMNCRGGSWDGGDPAQRSSRDPALAGPPSCP